MAAVDNLTLFVVGLVVATPTVIVVVALVFAAGVDERVEDRRQRDLNTASLPLS